MRQPSLPPLALPRAQEFPTLPPKLPKTLPKAEKDKKIFLNKGAFKEDTCTIYRACSLEKTPNLSSTTTTTLTPDALVTPIPTGVVGPLPEGTVGLVLGHSSLSFQGISVVPGVVDPDYTEEIKNFDLASY